MPTGTLPSEGKALWERVYEKAKKGSCKGDTECAARVAWTAVKQAGWSKDADGNWHKSVAVSEFSLAITRAAYDKATNRMNWRAVASDTDTDSYNDSMTLSLFEDFVDRIERNELPPEKHRSKFWSGGTPYMSISHYPDLDGKAVPGVVERVYVDGNRLKATGYFYDNPLGRACFKAICKDLYHDGDNGNDDEDREGKTRISIAFLDFAHRHKSTGYYFDRLTSKDEICVECAKELLEQSKNGLEFEKGLLIHMALTRVPVNVRTDIEPTEVDRSMAIKTRKDDALSIVQDDEEAKAILEEIDKEAKVVGKSELVIKSEEEVSETEETPKPELVEESAHKDKPMVDEDEDEDKDKKDKPKAEKKSMSEEIKPVLDALVELKSAIAELKSTPKEEEVVSHPLDGLFSNLRSAYDAAVSKEGTTPEIALQELQEPFNAFGSGVVETVRSNIHVAPPDLNKAVLDQIAELSRKMAEMSARIETRSETEPSPLRRRSLASPAPIVPNQQPSLQKRAGGVKSIAEIVEATT